MTENEKNRVEGGVLYLVGTPIGNLSDITERAKKVLSEVSFVAAEDTRNSAKLLLCLGIKNELVSYFEHNKRASGERIVARLLSGESCALITDAGMPAISDPGEDIVRLCAEAGIRVCVVPGACAAVSALAISALPTGKFVFEGFLSASKSERRARLSELSSEKRTLIFYEAPHKLRATLSDMAEFFGNERRISLCRELTKINEEVMRTTVGAAIDYYSQTEPRGEYVLIADGSSSDAAAATDPLLFLSEREHVSHYENSGMKRMDAIKAAARDRGISKSELYSKLLKDSE